MNRKRLLKSSGATIALFGMLANTAMAAEPAITLATSKGTTGAGLAIPLSQEPQLSTQQKLALIKQKIKYVFVLFQENRSFDGYFGTYPGANGLFSTFPGADPNDAMAKAANQTASFTQNIRNIDGSYGTITPFLAPRTIKDVNGNTVQLYPESFYSVDHSHGGYINDFHLQDANKSITKNDGYALDQEGLAYLTASSSVGGGNVVKSGTTAVPTSNPSLSSKQKGEAVMAHEDCDTIPFLWHYADVGTLFDNMHQTITGPSTPNAIALISAQSGATQWAEHPATTGTHTIALSVPNETDTGPFSGSPSDTYAGKPPYGPDEASFNTCATPGTVAGEFNNLACTAPLATDPAFASYTANAVVALKGSQNTYFPAQIPLTYASLPLSFMGSDINAITAHDANPAVDLVDIQKDIGTIRKYNQNVNWAWYQQGYGPEPFDGAAVVDTFPANTPHSSYIVHHNGPQYFGYLGDNPVEISKMHGLQQFYTDVANNALPAAGGVFYVRGGYYNNDGLVTADPSPAVRALFEGNDDHGSYSDSQISEALVADSVNAIANSPYWSQSAILIIWDESDGFYDHVPESIRSWGPDHLPLSGGPRIPSIVLSPYATAHGISHVYSEHGSAVRAISGLFGLTPLSQLPNEVAAKNAAAADPQFNSPAGNPQTALGPNDDGSIGNLVEAFDSARLTGAAAPIPASAVIIPQATVLSLPHYGGPGCTALNITPTDYPNGYSVGGEIDPPPSDFNPRPTVSPGIPYLQQTIIGGVTTSPWTP